MKQFYSPTHVRAAAPLYLLFQPLTEAEMVRRVFHYGLGRGQSLENAALHNLDEVARFLLENHVGDKWKAYPIAVCSGHLKIVELINRGHPRHSDAFLYAHLAAQAGHVHILEHFRVNGVELYPSLFIHAAANGHIQVLEYLLQHVRVAPHILRHAARLACRYSTLRTVNFLADLINGSFPE